MLTCVKFSDTCGTGVLYHNRKSRTEEQLCPNRFFGARFSLFLCDNKTSTCEQTLTAFSAWITLQSCKYIVAFGKRSGRYEEKPAIIVFNYYEESSYSPLVIKYIRKSYLSNYP